MYLCIRSKMTLCAGLLAGALAFAGESRATVLLADDFGFGPLNTSGGVRLDAAGNPVVVNAGSTLDQLRVETPSSPDEVWATGIGARQSHVSTWQFAVGDDPFETNPSPSDQQTHGVMFLGVIPGTNDVAPPGATDALLPFAPPPGAFQESMDVVAQSGSATAGGQFSIGFTSSVASGNLYDNFANFGQASLTLETDQNRGSLVNWTLRTNGLLGPSLSGTTVIQDWNQLALSYDPATHSVVGSINGVSTGALTFDASNIQGVGFEGAGAADNFVVQTGALQFAAAAVPEPSSWALTIAGFGGLGAMLRRSRRRRVQGLAA